MVNNMVKPQKWFLEFLGLTNLTFKNGNTSETISIYRIYIQCLSYFSLSMPFRNKGTSTIVDFPLKPLQSSIFRRGFSSLRWIPGGEQHVSGWWLT
jgi:hypothetical protein